MKSVTTKVWLTREELAVRLGTTRRALDTLAWKGQGPTYVRLPGVGIRYRIEDIEAWEQSGAEA